MTCRINEMRGHESALSIGLRIASAGEVYDRAFFGINEIRAVTDRLQGKLMTRPFTMDSACR
jgi:hypothetical protein